MCANYFIHRWSQCGSTFSITRFPSIFPVRRNCSYFSVESAIEQGPGDISDGTWAWLFGTYKRKNL
jgi:hypothetical protein